MTVQRPILVAPATDSLSRAAPRVTVSFDGGEQLNAQLLSCGRYVGGRPLDSATFEIKVIGSVASHRLGFDVIGPEIRSVATNQTVTVETTNPPQQLHFGKIVNVQARVSADGESIIVHSRMDDHLFGEPVDTLEFAIRSTSSLGGVVRDFEDILLHVDVPLVFNPRYEGVSTPNALNSEFWFGRHVFVDPRSVPIDTLKDDRRDDTDAFLRVVKFWSLAEAVHYLMWTLNENQTYVRNPSLAELRAVLGRDTNTLRNVTVRKGTYLPEALDQLLRPHGFGWFVDLQDRLNRRLCVFEFRNTTTLTLPYMPVDSRLVVREQAVASFDLGVDMVNQSFNRVVILGDEYERELSVILRPGWGSSHDDQTELDYFDRDGAHWTEDGIPDAYRRFVLNESGDYIKFDREWWEAGGTNLGVILANPDDEDTGVSVASFWLTRRRRMFPCISRNKDGSAYGSTQGVYLEMWDPDEGSSGEWVAVQDKFNFQVLEDECGIWITDTRPFDRLRAIQEQHGIDKVALRATASFRAERRVRATAESGNSLLNDVKEQIIENRGFQFRLVETQLPIADLDTPVGKSAVEGFSDVVDDGSVDDRAKAQELANTLLTRFNSGLVEGFIELDGIDWVVQGFLGARLNKLSGRELSLNTSPAGARPKYPTIVGIEYDVQRQRTRLRIETLRNPGGLRIA